MDTNNDDLVKKFPELQDAEDTISRISEAFVAPEYARAAFKLIRDIVIGPDNDSEWGRSTVITSPEDFSNMIVTVGKWWLLNFHIADAEALEEGDDVEEIVPLDYKSVLEGDESSHSGNGVATAEDLANFDEEEGDDEMDDEFIEATYYQVGTFLLDDTIMQHETLFKREDLEFYAYDFPDERIAADRFYWGRMVWEPEDFQNEALVASIRASLNYIVTNYPDDVTYAEFRHQDFALLVENEALCDRAINAADFGDVVLVEGPDDDTDE